MEEGYWIHLPEDSIITAESCDRFLLDVLHQLLEFVKRITSELLSVALLLPPMCIIDNHYDGLRKISKLKLVDGKQVVEVTMILNDGQTFTVKSNPHKQLREAEQDGCIQLLCDMAMNKVFPTSPYTHLIPHFVHVQPFPPTINLAQIKNYRMLKNEFRQQLALLKLQVNETLDDPCCVDENSRLYRTRFQLHVVEKVTGKDVLKLSSCGCEGVGKDKAKEAAVKEVMEECILLTIIELK